MPKTLTQAEAVAHLERAFNEARRLQDRFSFRPQHEKKQLAVLQRVLPKLKRLARGAASPQDAVKPDELAALEALKPPAPAGKAP